MPEMKSLTLDGITYDSFVDKTARSGKAVTPERYGAKGDGSTDDTVAFQTALAENRVVFVPGGTYKLSDTLLIRENCCLELSQDTVLNFTQTAKNCIEMKRLANLEGNHATIFVPYTFNANVIHASTDVDSDGGNNANVPPFTKWDPQWKMSRYVTDINICKTDSRGFHYSVDGDCYGTAVYIKCDKNDPVTFMWGVNMSGLRIAGGFTYGIRIRNEGTAWNHDMRIEAVIDACETGVSVENCHMVHLAAAIQPRRAYSMSEVYSNYAKNGIKLVDSHNVDLSQSFVWDWQHARTDSPEYTHIAMYGNCYGVVLNEPRYYESSVDVRESIYTDAPSNLEKMIILQEPITRWFKPQDNEPYFFNGNAEKRLALKEEIDEYFQTDRVPGYTDALATATDTDGSVYNGIGYHKFAGSMGSDGFTYADGSVGYYGHTGFIPCKAGDTLYFKNFDFQLVTSLKDGWCRAHLYDANFNHIAQNSIYAIINGSTTAYFTGGSVTDDGGTLVVNAEQTNAAYARFSFRDEMFGIDPVISVNEPIEYAQHGFLADSIKVKAENVIGNTVLTSPSGKKFVLSVSDNGQITATPIN